MIPYPPREKSYMEERNDAIETDRFAADFFNIIIDYMDEDTARVIGYNLAHVRTAKTEDKKTQHLVAAAKALLNAVDAPMEKAIRYIMDNEEPSYDNREDAEYDRARQEEVDRGRT